MRHDPLNFIPGLLTDSVVCPICLSPRQAVTMVGHRQHLAFAKRIRLVSIGDERFSPLEQQLLKCPSCQVCHLHPLPSRRQLEQHYKESSKLHGTLELSSYMARLNAPEQTLTGEPRDVVSVIANEYGIAADELRGGFIADIGCNAADFLAGFRALGFDFLLGVEPDPILQERNAKFLGCDVHIGLADTVPESYLGRCSLVVLRDTLEHLLDPVETITRAWQMLRPGGVIYIKVPNFDCSLVQHNLNAYDWFEVDHLFYFTPSSVNYLLTSCGFEQMYSKTVPSGYDREDLSTISDGKEITDETLEQIGNTKTGRVLQAFGVKSYDSSQAN